MAIDLDKYLQDKISGEPTNTETPSDTATSEGVDLDKYLADKTNGKAANDGLRQDVIDTVRGAGQGVTFGFEDELAGILAAARKLPSLSTDEISNEYSRVRDSERAANKASEERSPWLYGIGELAGGFAIPLPGTGIYKTATQAEKSLPLLRQLMTRGVIEVDKNASRGSRIGQIIGRGTQHAVEGAATGGKYGALFGAGKSEASITDPTNLGSDIAQGATQGAAFGAAIPGIIAGLKVSGTAANALDPIQNITKRFQKGVEGINLNDLTIHSEKMKNLVNEMTDISLDTKSRINQLYEKIKSSDQTVDIRPYVQEIEQLALQAKKETSRASAINDIDNVLNEVRSANEGVMQNVSIAETVPGKMSSYDKMHSDLLLQKAKLEANGYQVESQIIKRLDDDGREILVPKLTYRKGDEVGELYDDLGRSITDNADLAEKTKILMPKLDIPEVPVSEVNKIVKQRVGRDGNLTVGQAKDLQTTLGSLTQEGKAALPTDQGQSFALKAKSKLNEVLDGEQGIPGLSEANSKWSAINKAIEQFNLEKTKNPLTGEMVIEPDVYGRVQSVLKNAFNEGLERNKAQDKLNLFLDSLQAAGTDVSQLRSKIPEIVDNFLLAEEVSGGPKGNPASKTAMIAGLFGGAGRIVGKTANWSGRQFGKLDKMADQFRPSGHNFDYNPSLPSPQKFSDGLLKGYIGTKTEEGTPPKIDSPMELSRTVTNLPNEDLQQMAQELKMLPGMETDGDALEKALQNPNSIARNARIFSILSKKGGRELVRKYLSK